MRNWCSVWMCLLASAVWAAPSFTDLDSWQLPQPEPAKPAAAPRSSPKSTEPEEPEIRVEMSANSSYTAATNTQDPDEIPIFRRSADQLAKRLAGKSRFYVLFNANVVSSYDGMITGEDDVRYALVRFGKEEGPYRKFLFEGRGDQQLLAVAEDVPGVLRINARYGVLIPISENSFTKTYPNSVLKNFRNEQENKDYHVYQVDGPFFLAFENGQLVKQLSSAKELVTYMQSIGAIDVVAAARAARLRSEAKLAQQEQQAPPRTSFKALVEGGTLQDKMNLPHVVHPEDYDGAPLPPLTPSGPKAGTVLLRDVDGKYMNKN